MSPQKKIIVTLQEYSIPLISGVVVAMVFANVNPDAYHAVVHTSIIDLVWPAAHAAADHHGGHDWRHFFSLHFLSNDILMALFFGIAAKEITEACLAGGPLNPIRKAVNPLFATVGGVLGPVAVFVILNRLFGSNAWSNGWGIPTATDIALAWLVARMMFGKGHPAVSFLLLLAVADDAIGLGIIAFGYPNPEHPVILSNLAWLIPGMGLCLGLRLREVATWVPYILIGGSICWYALFSAQLHPALALVFVVPFLPPPARDLGLFRTEEEAHGTTGHHHSPLEAFEHDVKPYVDFGLFFFALANAGVPMSEINGLTWILLTALLAGKVMGITLCGWIAERLGFPLPSGMTMRHLIVVATVAAIGLTVALFISGQAFTDPVLVGAAKMGAILSGGLALFAFILSELLGVTAHTRALFPSRAQNAAPVEVPGPAASAAATTK